MMSNEFGRASRVEDEFIRRVERRQPPYTAAKPIVYEGGGVTCFRRDDAPVARPTATPVAPLPVREPVTPMATVTIMGVAPAMAPTQMLIVNTPAPASRSDLDRWDFARPSPRLTKREKRKVKDAKAKRNLTHRLEHRFAAVDDRAIIAMGWSRGEVQRMISSGYTAWGLARLESLIADIETKSREFAKERSCRVEQKVAAQAK